MAKEKKKLQIILSDFSEGVSMEQVRQISALFKYMYFFYVLGSFGDE